mmetsp:Transcript_35785/g.43199  ORF Transcript_35785/g.43199 Transcript_35785/m.43199 type:complete len:610 (-) Transcript_35785:354-2183(-)|eukprot:CAMPEP_0197848136 /NCGR_PEP_ID=MMETSP1438-20131217/7943_1 /TAXON_ID=1461541 /ORGANISM="Pterosperma sp., Strain CCMP1384" /LENGTH=609 /DNA_ID=CAMNT_0043460275 /DNA_START=196 /DNA_END=2025 /DNA_ORIENTATION=+
MGFKFLGLSLLVGSFGFQSTNACTTLIAGKKATVDGSVMCTHSNDGDGNTDPRMVFIPAADHPEGSMRPIYYTPETYPRYVGTDPAVPAYHPVGDQTPFVKIGEIPQVPHTFQYFSEQYGAMNEHQVGIGESTCSGIFGAKALGHGGYSMMSVDTLSYLAMERCATSRCAVQLMGDMAVKYGFYGADSFEGTSESLMVTDPNEGFIFHILPDNTNKSAIWAAQRVPDDHVGVIANVFGIREIDIQDHENFLYSENIFRIAEEVGKWSPGEPFDFAAIYSAGEYEHKYYSGRRVWGAYNLLAHEQGFSPSYAEWRKSKPYPATAKPDKLVGVEDFMKVHRYYYQGTEFDQTATIAAGPYGTPDHVYGINPKVKGNWERTIGLYRTTDSYVVQSRSWLPNEIGGVLWWGAHSAPYTNYVPFAAGMTSLPGATLGHQAKLDKSTFFHANRYIANLAQIKWNYIMEDVAALQAERFKASLAVQALVDSQGTSLDKEVITELYTSNAIGTLSATWEAFDALMFKYADGYITTLDESTPNNPLRVSAPSVPAPWLEAVGYPQGPPPVPQVSMFQHNVANKSECSGVNVKECIDKCTNKLELHHFKGCVASCTATC